MNKWRRFANDIVFMCFSSLTSTDVTVAVTLTCSGTYYNGSTTDELKAECREVKVRVLQQQSACSG